MQGLSGVIRELAGQLGQQFPQAEFVPERSGESLYRRLERPLGCVSLLRVAAKESALGDCYGAEAGGFLFGKEAELTVGISLYCREEAGPEGCIGLFSAISEALLFDPGLALREVSCGAAEYLPKREVYRLEIQARLGVLLVRGGDEAPVSGFRLNAADMGE